MQDHFFTRDFSLDGIDSGVPAAEMLAAQPRPGTGRVIVQFFKQELRDEAMSTARGRYVPRAVDMARIIIPGDKHNIVERKVQPADKIKYPQQWAAFEKQESFTPDGTPIEAWPMISRSQVYELKAANIFSVEDIAALSDEQLPVLGLGARMLRKHAKAFLEASAKGVPSAKLVSENELLKGQISTLTQQLSDLSKRFEAELAKNGRKVEDVSNPATEARAEILATTTTPPVEVVIPKDFQRRNLTELKEIVNQFSDAVITSKADALELIGEYLAKRDLAAAA